MNRGTSTEGRTGNRCRCFFTAILVCCALGCAVAVSAAESQSRPAQSGQKQLKSNIQAQNNLKKEISLLIKRREEARSRALLSRTAKDRKAYLYWKDQMFTIQREVVQSNARLGRLEAKEQDIRTAIRQGGRSRHPNNAPSGGKTVIPPQGSRNMGGNGSSSGSASSRSSGSGLPD